ncbi:MAG: hypothetical protein WKF76_12915 [Nocardioidaceae bacterium]
MFKSPSDTSATCACRSVLRIIHRTKPAASIPQEDMGYHCHEYRIREAGDVHQVLEWAHATATPEQTFTLYVERRAVDGVELDPSRWHRPDGGAVGTLMFDLRVTATRPPAP